MSDAGPSSRSPSRSTAARSTAAPGETIWQVAAAAWASRSRISATRPRPAIGPTATAAPAWSRSRASACSPPRASASRPPGMKVTTASERAKAARAHGLRAAARRPARARDARTTPTRSSGAGPTGVGVDGQPLPARAHAPAPDRSHPAMAVHLDACIQCKLCVRACREVQVNDVIGMADRGHGAKIVFDFDDPMGQSTCVACGECVQACPTGALMPAPCSTTTGAHRPTSPTARSTASAPIAASAASSPITSRTTSILYVDGRDGPANHNRLCVKGRFGFDYVHHPHRLTKPLIRKAGVPKDADDQVDPANPWTHFREATWDEALDVAAGGPEAHPRPRRRPGPGRLRLGQGLERGGLSVPEAGAHRLRHQQRRSLHAALPRLVGRRADGDDRLGRGDGAVLRARRRRRHRRHRRQPDGEPPGRRDLHQERGEARRQADRHRPARPGAEPPRRPTCCQFRPGTDVAC